MKVELTLVGSEAQQRFWNNRARFRAFVGGVGSGKTFAGCSEIFSAEYAGRLGIVVAPTYPMLRDATVRTFLAICDRAERQGLRLLVEFNKSEMRAELVTGTTILFRSADQPDRLRGPNLGWFYLDEAAMMGRLAWDVLIGRLREPPGRAWLTTTPRGFNWVHDLFVEQALPGYELIRCPSTANPYLPPEFITSLRAAYGSGAFARQEIGGEFVRPEGAIFKREWFGIIDHAPAELRWARCWDLAASTKETGDYTAGARCTFADDGTLYIADVVRGRWEWPDARAIIIQTAQADGADTEIGIEKIAFQLAAIQELYREPAMVHLVLREVVPDKDKVARAMPWQARAEQGKVALIRGGWNSNFLAEVCDFPLGDHDDQVDAVSGAVQMLTVGAYHWTR